MKKSLNILACGWLAIWLLIGGIMVYRNNVYKTNATRNLADIQPVLDHILRYQSANERTPTEGELKDWMNETQIKKDFQYITKNNYPKKDSAIFRSADWSKDFAIGLHNIGRVDYYTSWNKQYITTPLAESTMVISALFLIFLGVLPFPLLWLINRKK
ncbi:MAG: hypothetical protein V4613_07715 [Bacteroidota bacterium]